MRPVLEQHLGQQLLELLRLRAQPFDIVARRFALTNSSKNSLFMFSADGSSLGSGVALSDSSSNSIYDFDARDNAIYGVWLQGSSSNSVRFAGAVGNAQAGIYLGCSQTAGPSGTPCPRGSKASSKNTLTAIQAGNDTAMSLPELFGVAVDLGQLQNNLSGISASGDSMEDLDDLNANCGTNIWFADSNGAGTLDTPTCTNALDRDTDANRSGAACAAFFMAAEPNPGS
jgi:parallel beta-helix repeat protein